MKLLVAQLSDIHLRESANAVSSRVAALAAAIRSEALSADVLIVALSGDVAYSGDSKEYQVAKEILSDLRKHLPSILAVVAVPGNHDCNFRTATTLRDALLATPPATLRGATPLDTSLTEPMTSVQGDFFQFLSDLNGEPPLPSKDWLAYRHRFEVQGVVLVFDCYNTAWMSQKSERQGKLLFPDAFLLEPAGDATLVISMFHHPYGWLDSDNARAFRRHIERSSDVVLTGHEHESHSYHITALSGEEAAYVEGAVLQTQESHETGFNIVMIDLAQRQWRVIQYDWRRGDRMFTPRATQDWREFHRNSYLRRGDFTNTADYAAHLADVGATFSHPRATAIRLDDIFVYPTLDDLSMDRKADHVVDADDVPTFAMDNRRLLIMGQERAGKTTLAKTFYKLFQHNALVPVLLSGESLRAPDSDATERVVERAFAAQYGADLFERYRQLPLSARVLIVDDFHRTPLNRKGRSLFLDHAVRLFDRIILFADEIFQLKELAQHDDGDSLLSYRTGVIRELGHARRAELIDRWYALGSDYSLSEELHAQTIERAERTIDTLLGKNVVPAYPIFVLTFLQSLEANTPLNTAAGSYGYIYELLITAALSKTDSGMTLDTKYTYISRLAFLLFEHNKGVLSDDDVTLVSESYFRDYKIRVSQTHILADLLKSPILTKVPDGYQFKYKYVYYYFVAHYLQEGIISGKDNQRLKSLALDLTKRIYNEDAANILIFFIYLTKDPDIIGAVVQNARSIFSEIAPCNMDSHVKFITDSGSEQLKFTYYDTEHKEGRRRHLKKLDDAEQLHADNEEPSSTDDDVEINETLKLNVAFKTLQIMGQILRNFPGSLRGDTKLDIARECYLLGLRTLNFMLAMFQGARDVLRELFMDYLRTRRNITDPDVLNRRADQFWFLVTALVGVHVVKSISGAVGSENLRETYKEVISEIETPALRLIDIAIKLDHFRPIPRAEVIELARSMSSNMYAVTILRQVVVDFLYLFPADYKTKQMLCQALNISIESRALDPQTRKGS